MASDQTLPREYDATAAAYARYRSVNPEVVRALVDSGHFGPASRILDVGCGTGNYAAALHSLTGCQMSGVEPSSEMLARARSATTWSALVQGRAEHLPFPDDAFDVVMTTDVIHHISDRETYFREATRVLRPGGRVVTVTDSHDDILARRPLSNYFPETVEVELKRYPSISQLEHEMHGAGFVTTETVSVNYPYELVDSKPYREKAFSSLTLLDDAAFARGLARMEADLARGPIPALSLYTMLWGTAKS